MEEQTEHTSDKKVISAENRMLAASEKRLFEQAQKLYGQNKAYHTRRVYMSDWRIFSQWCQHKNITAASATHETIALFLTDQFEQERIHPKTLTRRLAAIKSIFTERGIPSPTDHPVVRNLLKGIRRDEKAPPSKAKNALVADIVKSMVDLCPTDTLRGIRDKTILLIGFVGAFRRSELANIQIEDISFNVEGIDIKIRHSKTDKEKEGALIAIVKADNENYCPCTAVTDWLEKSKVANGALFRGITKHQKLTEGLSEDRLYALVKKYATLLGFEIDHFSPHSLRSGFITSALENNALPSKVMEQSRHKSLKSLQPYIKHVDRYKQHAGKNLL